MNSNRQVSRAQHLERINLRLSAEALVAIDVERSRRAGNVSRNTWIIEAIQERLDRLKSSDKTSYEGNG